jgi:hypothetical protein
MPVTPAGTIHVWLVVNTTVVEQTPDVQVLPEPQSALVVHTPQMPPARQVCGEH